MGILGRTWVATATTVAVGVVALLFVEVGQPLIDMLNNGSSGPFTDIGSQIQTLWAPVLALILLAIWAWVVAGAVQRQPERRRPRP